MISTTVPNDVHEEESAEAALLTILARALAPFVARELAGVGVVYTVIDPPPGRSARWARENLRKVPGARVHGRAWSVTREAWLAYEAAEADRRRAKRKPKNELAAGQPANDAVSLLAAAGLRGTR